MSFLLVRGLCLRRESREVCFNVSDGFGDVVEDEDLSSENVRFELRCK